MTQPQLTPPEPAGFIGLGNIGMPMARCLVRAGLPAIVFDVLPERSASLVDAGARAASSPAKLAEACATVGICVRDESQVRQVLCADDGVFAGARRGCVVALHGTVRLDTVLELGSSAQARGIGLVDACVTGGERHAAAGNLTTMVGGSADDVARITPVLRAFSKAVFQTGGLGSGTIVKLCNNLMGYLAWTAAYEGRTLARAAGISDEIFEAVTRSGGHLTDAMSAFLGSHKLPADVRASDAFRQRMQAFVEIAEKDLAAALELARQHGVTLAGTAAIAPLMARVYGVDPA